MASFCQLLQRRYAGQLDERADQYIAFAVDGAQRMQRLINDLLAFSRIGRTTAGFTDVDLDDVVARPPRSWTPARRRRRVDRARRPADGGGRGVAAADAVHQPDRQRAEVPPPRRAAARPVSAQGGRRRWQINVADNGIGIEPEYADKVFVIFQRLHARDGYEGTGIGLAIAKKIVEFHGGRIWLDPPRGNRAPRSGSRLPAPTEMTT